MQKKSAWLTIWVHPRDTIRKIVAKNPNKGLWILALIYGFSSLLGTFQSFSLGSHVGAIAIFILALVFAPIWGYIIFSVWGWVILWTGKMLKGAADFRQVRASFAWSNVPMIVSDLIWIITIAVAGSAIFMPQANDGNNIAQGASYLLLAFALVKVVMSIWSLVICVNTLAEVQRYSVLRAIGNLILAAILIAIFAALVSFIVMFLVGNPTMQAASMFFNY